MRQIFATAAGSLQSTFLFLARSKLADNDRDYSWVSGAATQSLPGADGAEALHPGRSDIEDLALAYLQLAIYLAPNHPLALMSLADLYESIKKPALAIKVSIPRLLPGGSPGDTDVAGGQQFVPLLSIPL